MSLILLLHSFAQSPVTPGDLPQPADTSSVLQSVLTIVFGIVGALSLLMITVSGFRYIISGSDPQGTAKAKAGLVYALVGLVVAISAEAIVAFVINRL